MTLHLFTAIALAFASASGAAAANVVYDNTTTDTLNTIVYSSGPYTQIGDLVTLGGTGRSLTGATVQFFNAGDVGSFDAVLRIWNPGAPVGAQIGGNYQVAGLNIGANSTLNVSFVLPGLLVPDTLIATVQILNTSAGTDPGLDLFEPPALGSSDNNTFIVEQSGSFQTATTGLHIDNLYLTLEATAAATDAPEPATCAMFSGILIVAGIARRARRWASPL